MKEQYVAPTIEVVEIENQQLMLTVSGEQIEVGSGNNSGSGVGTPDLVNKRRGKWGNLWQ